LDLLMEFLLKALVNFTILLLLLTSHGGGIPPTK
jgi:hypothetical protein